MTKMTGLRIFYAWGATIATGSILLFVIAIPFIGLMALYAFLLTLLYSVFSSFPALIVLLLANARYGKDPGTQPRKMTIVHIWMYVLTMAAGSGWLYYEQTRHNYGVIYAPIFAYMGIVTYYAGIAAIFWNKMFRK